MSAHTVSATLLLMV